MKSTLIVYESSKRRKRGSEIFNSWQSNYNAAKKAKLWAMKTKNTFSLACRTGYNEKDEIKIESRKRRRTGKKLIHWRLVLITYLSWYWYWYLYSFN